MIPEPFQKNFDTLLRAARNGDLALLECTDKDSGQVRHVICAMQWNEAEQKFDMIPFGHLCPGNPYDMYDPPEPDAKVRSTYNPA